VGRCRALTEKRNHWENIPSEERPRKNLSGKSTQRKRTCPESPESPPEKEESRSINQNTKKEKRRLKTHKKCERRSLMQPTLGVTKKKNSQKTITVRKIRRTINLRTWSDASFSGREKKEDASRKKNGKQ